MYTLQAQQHEPEWIYTQDRRNLERYRIRTEATDTSYHSREQGRRDEIEKGWKASSSQRAEGSTATDATTGIRQRSNGFASPLAAEATQQLYGIGTQFDHYA
ncbi:MAG: hypothetical protein K9L28_05420 [Synergistales bacterium]|nr:hypothetical protein [Synergistales bacterium]